MRSTLNKMTKNWSAEIGNKRLTHYLIIIEGQNFANIGVFLKLTQVTGKQVTHLLALDFHNITITIHIQLVR